MMQLHGKHFPGGTGNSYSHSIISHTDNFHESRESKADNNTFNKNENQGNFEKSTQTKPINQTKNLEDEN